MTEVKTVFQAVVDVMNDVKAVGKGGRNDYDGYDFRGIDGVMNATGPALRAHGVIAVPMVEHAEHGTSTTAKGAVMTTVRIKMIVRWYGPAGDHFDTIVWGEAFDRGDKATAKAHSVAFRTAILQTLCLPTQEPDPDESSYEQGNQSQPPTRSRGQYVNDFSSQLLKHESAGNLDGIRQMHAFVVKEGDGELVQMSSKVLERLQQAQAPVVDGEVVPDGPPTT